MRRHISLLATGAATAIIFIAAGCSSESPTLPPLVPSAVIAPPAGSLVAGASVVWQVNIGGTIGPCNVAWDFGGGAEPNTQTATDVVGSATSLPVVLNEGSWIATVTVTNAAGASVTDSAAYTVGPAPVIHATAAFVAGNIVVSTDAADDALTFSVDAPDGFYVGNPQPSIVGGGPGALIPVSAMDIATGASGSLTVHVTGDDSAPGLAILNVTIPPLGLLPDTLYAIPMERTVHVGEPVTVVIATGIPAHPFQYMVGVGLVLDADAEFVEIAQNKKVNYGSPGGEQGDIDGIWAAMQPSGGFLLAPDDGGPFMTDIGGGLRRLDLNCFPLGGHNLTNASGAMINVPLKYGVPGIKHFGFQQFSGVKRTYYADDASEYFWGDISNDHPGIPNSVTVTP